MTTTVRASRDPGLRRPATGKRTDIQGLRAIAVAAVVLYHAEVFGIPGGFVGVDVFFVISGFLITGHLVRDLERRGGVDFLAFYANRIRRLMPAATTVLVATAALTYLFIPVTRWSAIAGDIAAAAVYGENWRLAAGSVDYLTQDSLPSPVQHFWSLGVEEQFYIVWPLVIAAVGVALVLARRRSGGAPTARALRGGLCLGLLLIAAPSFVCSVVYTHTHPAQAYFVTTTRLWELALGGFVAIYAPSLRSMPVAVRTVLAWVGLAGILVSVLALHASTPFPGVWALLPTLATAAVIAGGGSAGRLGPNRLLDVKPVQALGDMSYSVYLWHWPIIIVAKVRFQGITLPVALGAIAVALVASAASYHWVEQPARRARWASRRGLVYGLGVAGICLSVAVAAVLAAAAHSRSASDLAALQKASGPGHSSDTAALGAAALPDHPADSPAGRPVDRVRHMVPSALLALNDQLTCTATVIGQSEVSKCTYGDARSTKHVAVVGDSHAGEWLPALELIAKKRHWALTGYLHNSCPFATGPLTRYEQSYDDCIKWNVAVHRTLMSDKKLAAVFTSSLTDTAVLKGTGDAVGPLAAAYQASWSAFTRKGVPVVSLRDTPGQAPFNVPECVAVHESALSKCAFPRSAATRTRGLALMEAARHLRGAVAVDLNDAICPDDPCAPVIGNVLVYRDNNHVTATYMRSLTPRLERAIRGVKGIG